MVDVETTGPCPGLFSMVQFGAVIVEPGLKRTFKGELKPLDAMDDDDTVSLFNSDFEAYITAESTPIAVQWPFEVVELYEGPSELDD